MPNSISLKTLDGKYWTCSLDDLKRILEWDWTDQRKWASDRFDCDDFAFMFRARMAWFFGINAIAFVDDYSAAHAYNIMVMPDGTLRGIEPQNDLRGIIGKGSYTLQRGRITI